MSELQRLINKLCPDGVEYKKLADVAEISTGLSNTNDAIENGIYPFYVRSQEPLKKNDYEYDEEAVITAGDGVGVGKVFHYINGKYALHQRAYRIHITFDELSGKYLYYYFISKFPEYIKSQLFQGSVPSIRRPMLNKFKIPVPPMPVQREIVHILDNFTDYIACLEKELELRKNQYKYYRDMLLNFNDNVEWNTLGEVCIIKNGRDYKSFGSGGIPVYGSGGIIAYTSKFAFDEPFWNVDTIFYTDINTTKVIPKYLYYYLSKEHLEQYNTAGGVPSLTQKVLNNIKIPVPPIEEQERIVKILDHFDRLCNDLTDGLPAEINARQKQYEYYRDKLLMFKVIK